MTDSTIVQSPTPNALGANDQMPQINMSPINGVPPHDHDGINSPQIDPSNLALLKTIGCRVRATAVQGFSDATLTAVNLNTEDFDTDNMHDTVTNNYRLYCKTAGTYMIGAQILWATGSTGERLLQINYNGQTCVQASNDGAFDRGACIVTTTIKMAVNDYLDMYARQSSGGPLNSFADNLAQGASPVFWALRIGS